MSQIYRIRSGPFQFANICIGYTNDTIRCRLLINRTAHQLERPLTLESAMTSKLVTFHAKHVRSGNAKIHDVASGVHVHDRGHGQSLIMMTV